MHPTKFATSESWVILSPIEQQIKEKIEKVGTPLKDWDIRINYGIKTGFNEAFIIDGAKRKELIAEDPKSEEIIRPLLRGRDIKRYSYEFADLYLLFVPWHFPLHNNPNITGASLKAEKEFENQYPAIYNHLLKYKKELSNRNKAETGIRYEWYALQRWGANYWEEFYRQKIVWAETIKEYFDGSKNFPRFCLDSKEMLLDKTCFMLLGDNLTLLMGILNSSVIEYFLRQTVVKLGMGSMGLSKIFIEQIPLVKPNFDTQKSIENLVNNIKLHKNKNLPTHILEYEIDKIVYKLYNLTTEEIEFIELQ